MTLQDIFAGIDHARVAVIGDFCLDVYWMADMTRSQISRETPHFPLPIVSERMNCGGAGNVACNVAALKPSSVLAFGATGRDWRGDALRKLLRTENVQTDGLLEVPGRMTTAYCKPLRKGLSEVVYEDPRLDFENTEPLSEELQARLLELLSVCDADIICVCDQLDNGCIGPLLRNGLSELGKQGRAILVDSRDHISQYHHVIVKPNEIEAGRLYDFGKDYHKLAKKLTLRNGKPALITLGDKGCVVCEGDEVTAIPARTVAPPIDICGAGDTFLSGLACALAAGCSLTDAAFFANTASAVTIKKIHTTGTASREEIAALWG